MSSFDIRPPNMSMFHEWAIRTQLHTDIVPDLSHVIYKSIFSLHICTHNTVNPFYVPAINHHNSINSVFSLYLNNDQNETISTVINDLTGGEGDERIALACTSAFSLPSCLIPLISSLSQFYQLQRCTAFPSRHYPSEDHGIAGKPQLMNVCVRVFQCFTCRLSESFFCLII